MKMEDRTFDYAKEAQQAVFDTMSDVVKVRSLLKMISRYFDGTTANKAGITEILDDYEDVGVLTDMALKKVENIDQRLGSVRVFKAK